MSTSPGGGKVDTQDLVLCSLNLWVAVIRLFLYLYCYENKMANN
jgi:hypothetical protein